MPGNIVIWLVPWHIANGIWTFLCVCARGNKTVQPTHKIRRRKESVRIEWVTCPFGFIKHNNSRLIQSIAFRCSNKYKIRYIEWVKQCACRQSIILFTLSSFLSLAHRFFSIVMWNHYYIMQWQKKTHHDWSLFAFGSSEGNERFFVCSKLHGTECCRSAAAAVERNQSKIKIYAFQSENCLQFGRCCVCIYFYPSKWDSYYQFQHFNWI